MNYYFFISFFSYYYRYFFHCFFYNFLSNFFILFFASCFTNSFVESISIPIDTCFLLSLLLKLYFLFLQLLQAHFFCFYITIKSTWFITIFKLFFYYYYFFLILILITVWETFIQLFLNLLILLLQYFPFIISLLFNLSSFDN